jgi:hypothetical protein
MHKKWIAMACFLAAAQLFAQSGREYRRSSVMRGNLVKTVFGNWGVIGQPAEKGARGAWIYDNNGYIGDVSPLVGAEIRLPGATFHSVEICPISRPTRQNEISPAGKPWGFEPVAGYFNETQEGIALYSDDRSWPATWPDKMDDPEDPGWSGSWNGFFGKTTTASEESYFVMDDRNDEEFNFSENNQWRAAFKPDANDASRSGLGFSMSVRGMQWPDFLAQDCIFWLYQITNHGTTDYDKVVFGMLVGTYVGVTSTEDYREYDDDYSFFDVEKDLTYTADFDDDASRNPRWRGPVGVVGYAFLESPGNQYDGIDNDGDDGEAAAAPLFTEADFQARVLDAGDRVVLIDRDYRRSVVSVTAGTTVFVTRGDSVEVTAGVTALVEGNVMVQDGEEIINPNAYDGVDNDLDGLIDENYYLHYHQIRKDSQGNVLIDRFNPVRHFDYVTGLGLGDALIDERRDDGIDNDGDWNSEFDDVGADGVGGTGDRGEGDGRPTAGEPNFDRTDVDESDQIGLTSFEYFAPANEFSMADDEDLWRRLSPGYFEVPSSIMNNKPVQGEDGDFIYGSGYFPLRAGETQGFSLALVYGEGGGPDMEITDLLRNRETVQDIYDSDYRFPPAPEKPTLTATAGDGRVVLTWDRRAEKSVDPVLHVNDFEGYKIYKATDSDFNDCFGITDADGNPIAYKPAAQFDLKNGVNGYFRAGADLYQGGRGASFYLGNDSGLKHSFVDTDVENGKRYFYAVVAYDRGDAGKDVFPKENDKRIDVLSSGEVRTFQNTACLTPNAPVAGYEAPPGSVEIPAVTAVGTGKVFHQVLDESAVTGHTYRVEFWDTSNDGIDNDGDGRMDGADSSETFVPITTSYSVTDLTGGSESFVSRDTVAVRLTRQHLDVASVSVTDASGAPVPADRYNLDAENGRIQSAFPGGLARGGLFTLSYRFRPVNRSPHIERSPWASETLDTDVFDGGRMSFQNVWVPIIDTLRTGWKDPSKVYQFSLRVIDTYFDEEHLLGLAHPSDYRIEFADHAVDTSLAIPEFFIDGIAVNFRIYNETDGRYVDFVYNNTMGNRKLSPYDEIVLVESGLNGAPQYTWDMVFTHRRDSVFTFGVGDTLFIRMKKPFRAGDVFEFTTVVPSANRSAASSAMNRIRAVPNPYIAATTHELPLPPAVTSGRGERRVDFIHCPAGSRVYLFTARGEHVVTLRHDGILNDGTVPWNLKTKENLDVAAGVYFWVVESDAGTQRGKLAVIK